MASTTARATVMERPSILFFAASMPISSRCRQLTTRRDDDGDDGDDDDGALAPGPFELELGTPFTGTNAVNVASEYVAP
eukprot:31307-Pelagococcus_subviridis.AAC.9